ncbi:hypothetical protein [Ferruginibacter sp.]|nr:hypothetical protein [Ferruginibacter sp.]
MKKTFLAFLVLLIATISCKKSSSPAETAQNYMDLTSGTTRQYQTTNNLTAVVTTNTITSTNRDSTINSKSYHVFSNNNGAGNEYYNITGNDYYTFRSLGAALGNLTVESVYLKANAAVNASWNEIVNLPFAGVPGGTVPVTLTYIIAEKGISRTVNSIAYTNVIRVTTTIAVTGLPPGSVTTDIQSYYAPKAGLIESKNKIVVPLLTTNVDQNTILLQ